ncbi:HAD family hydrolase [Aerococcus agrisoli]|uniref:HAD family hydrolase n=2 Tax=Aerococcus agrisoli TaxID=2487350 RepID=A0A3N4GDB0_9LACT|nr:HAD family hydrolase [Aerococcus agrisoli]
MKKIIFDMDGVLVDSEYTYLQSKTDILHEQGFMKDISYQYQFMGTTYDFMWQTMKDELGLPDSVETYIDKMNRYRQAMIERDGVRAIKNSVELVDELGKRGYQMAVASSSPKLEIMRNLRQLGITSQFAHLVSGEEVARSKPNPDIFEKAAHLLQAPSSECIVIEDTRNGVLAAKAAGMYTIGFANPDYPKQDLSKADIIVTDMMDALTIITEAK